MSITFGFFLIGIVFGRNGWIQKIHFKGNAVYFRLATAIFALVVFQYIGHVLNHKTGNWVPLTYSFTVFLQNISAMTFFILFVVMMFDNLYLQKAALWLASLGQMSLTNYLMQSVLAFVLFYGVGFGLFLQTTPFTNFLIAIVFILLQMVFSRYWLRTNRSGLVEWFLRLGTYWEYQTIKKPKKSID